MLLKGFQRIRSSRRRRFHLSRSIGRILVLLLGLFLLDFLLIVRRFHGFQFNLFAQTFVDSQDIPPNHPIKQQKIFITAQFWSSEFVLNNYWIGSFLRLVEALDPENVYVSILSSHSHDNTEGALQRLDEQLGELGVSRTLVFDTTTREDVISVGSEDSFGNPRDGWVVTYDAENSTGQPEAKELRRIPYLSELRNRALEPLRNLQLTSGKVFDRILYLNDVIFEPQDILTLLTTRRGDFDVACGLDYHYAPYIYDTFAARDISYRGPITAVFPFFGAPMTRDAMLAGLPAPVTSCWNGVVAVDATPYYHRPLPGRHEQLDNQAAQEGLRFRGVPDSLAAYHLEASECCLIHADLLATDQASRGIYINPAVRTAYAVEAYNATHFGRHDSCFINAWEYWSGVWVVRWRSWVWTWFVDAVSVSAGQNMREVVKRVGLWEREQTIGQRLPHREIGAYCTILEMQILLRDGWKHVKHDAWEMRKRHLQSG